MKKVFIGIDFSKLKFDVAIYSVESRAIVSTEVFENDEVGFNLFLQWVKEKTSCTKSGILFCGEHTSYYSGNSSVFLYETGYDMWLVSGLEMKLTPSYRISPSFLIQKLDAALLGFAIPTLVFLCSP